MFQYFTEKSQILVTEVIDIKRQKYKELKLILYVIYM